MSISQNLRSLSLQSQCKLDDLILCNHIYEGASVKQKPNLTPKTLDLQYALDLKNANKLIRGAFLGKIVKLVVNRLTQSVQLQGFYKLRVNGQKYQARRQSLGQKSKQQCSQIDSNDSRVHIQKQIEQQEIGFLALNSKCSVANKIQDKQLNIKNLNKSNLILQLENDKLSKKIDRLKQQLDQAIRRQEREVLKKRQSMEGLMQELAQKNQLIAQLKSSIRLLETKLGAKERGVLECLLEEDSQSLRRTVVRLESINDKLNFELEKSKKQINRLEQQTKKLAFNNNELQNQIRILKETNFDLELNRETANILRKEASTAQMLYRSKSQRVKRLQNRLSQVIKSKSLITEEQNQVDLQINSCKKTDTETTIQIFKRTSSLREENNEQKLQAVFNFLFHITKDNHDLHNADLFDEQQKQLLNTHRQLFLNSQPAKVMERDIKDDQFDIFGRSLDEILNHHHNEDVHAKDRQIIQKLQKECQGMISKVCSLKEKQMHIRNVLMNFLKSIDLRSIKKQTQAILAILFQLFEYSEGERLQICPPKARKILGFI